MYILCGFTHRTTIRCVALMVERGQVLQLYRPPPLPPITELARPELKLAGLRIDEEMNSRSRMSYYTGVQPFQPQPTSFPLSPPSPPSLPLSHTCLLACAPYCSSLGMVALVRVFGQNTLQGNPTGAGTAAWAANERGCEFEGRLLGDASELSTNSRRH